MSAVPVYLGLIGDWGAGWPPPGSGPSFGLRVDEREGGRPAAFDGNLLRLGDL
jgi:hypothetical protein